MSDFLPSGYKAPSASGGYMRFQKGKNKFRVLSSAIVGMEAWATPDSEGKTKPLRFKMGEPITGDFKDAPKHFWAFVVWNYQTESLAILEITQKSIQGAVRGFAEDTDWGNPSGYDITVTKEGEGMETRYSVMPAPAKAMPKEVLKAYKDAAINLEALFDGLDPFKDKSVEQLDESDLETPPELDDLPF